jgi:hypothetical protein
MANKFVLIPEDIYRGMTTTDTGNINLDHTKRSLENVKKERTDASTKNARYNQELRRYLHLRKEHEEKPVKVEMSGGLPPNIAPTPTSQSSTSSSQQSGVNQGTSSSAFLNEFMMRAKANPQAYNVNDKGLITNTHGKIITGSDINKTLDWIISNAEGNRAGARPKGTAVIESLIHRDSTLKGYIEDIKNNKNQSVTSTSKNQFNPSIWQ